MHGWPRKLMHGHWVVCYSFLVHNTATTWLLYMSYMSCICSCNLHKPFESVETVGAPWTLATNTSIFCVLHNSSLTGRPAALLGRRWSNL